MTSVEYAFKNNICLWIPALAGECSPAEIEGGEINPRTHMVAAGADRDVQVNSTRPEHRVYNKWNPVMTLAGYKSPLE